MLLSEPTAHPGVCVTRRLAVRARVAPYRRACGRHGRRSDECLYLDRVDAVRASCDAILVGAGTIRADDPWLLRRSQERRDDRAARSLPENPTMSAAIANCPLVANRFPVAASTQRDDRAGVGRSTVPCPPGVEGHS